MVEGEGNRPNNEALASPVRSLSKSAWIEFVWRTPRVYSEFMVPDRRGEEACVGSFPARPLRVVVEKREKDQVQTSNLIGRDTRSDGWEHVARYK